MPWEPLPVVVMSPETALTAVEPVMALMPCEPAPLVAMVPAFTTRAFAAADMP